jgi:hypothetical protein
MMTTALHTPKSTGLTKSGGLVLDLARRLERARQSRNEKIERADAEYVDAVRRAYEAISAPAPAAVAAEADQAAAS